MPHQRRSRWGRPVLMQELDIPIFFIRRLGDRQFVVGGGGGSAKTGIPNAVYLFSLTNRNGRCYLRQSQKQEIDLQCPMNAAVYEVTSSSLSPIFIDPRTRLPSISHGHGGKGAVDLGGTGEMPRGRPEKNARKMQQAGKEIMTMLHTVKELVAVGLDNTCAIYQVKRSLPHPQTQTDPSTTVKPVVAKADLISIQELFDPKKRTQTVDTVQHVQQCCVFIPPDQTRRNSDVDGGGAGNPADARLVVGGTDGLLRFFAGADFHPMGSIKVHEDEVCDVDVSSSGEEILTCGRDKKAHVWNVKTGKLIASALPDFPEAKTVAYRPRKGRFHCKEASVLYIIWIPTVRQRKHQDPSLLCLYRFRASRLVMAGVLRMTGEQLSALAVSPDGHYVATGDLDGAVSILRADTLSVIYTAPSAHETFITDLEFADCTFGAKILTQTENAQCTVFSVSADRKILLHQADFQYAELKTCRKWMKWPIVFWLIAFLVSLLSLTDFFADTVAAFHELN